MNFYNPYSFPYQNVVPKTSSLRSLLGKINFSSIIGSTQKTLTTINQIIPIVKQAKPMMDNAKTMFKLMSEFNRSDAKVPQENHETKKTTSNEVASNNKIEINNSSNGPTFFL